MKTKLASILSFFVRVSAFLRKEIFSIVRQPRLVLTLVLGPFLILLLFGIGYRSSADPLRTLFVAQQDNPFRPFIDQYADGMGPLIDNRGAVASLGDALEDLREDRADLVVELPADPVQQVRNSQHPVFTLYHNEMDPYQVEYINAFSRIFADQINRNVLTEIAARSQSESASVQESVTATQQAAGEMRQALERGDRTTALLQQNALVRSLDDLEQSLGTSTQLVENLEEQYGDPEDDEEDLSQRLATLRQETSELSSMTQNAGEEDFDDEIERVRAIEEEAAALEESLAEFRNIEPSVLASPFDAQVESVTPRALNFADFYVPAAIALLAQHMALTFAALSIVREQRAGAIELFQVSPLAPFEGLLGKYLSYFLLTALLLAVLTILSLVGLQVPMLGSWSTYVAILAALIFASLGLGFVISLISDTTSQAVQYSMIVLLASIFFGGFFLGLDLLQPFVRVVSWALPATYGTQLLQDVMLRGLFTSGGQMLLLGLGAMGLGLFILALLLLRRKMAQL